MTDIKCDRLIASAQKLRDALEGPVRESAEPWAKAVHAALGRVAATIQEDVEGVERTKENLGDANPDIQFTPTVDRHIESTRGQLIQLGEIVHHLRADIREASDVRLADVPKIRARGQEIVYAIEKARKDDDKFMLDAVNSNPGAGE